MTASESGRVPPPPPDPRKAVRACCGDTHWGPEPKDYPCPEPGRSPSLPEVEELTPMQELVVEVLGARYRLGEHVWTLTSRVRPTLRALAGLGYIGWKSGIVEGTCLAWLTPEGVAKTLDASYVPPILRVSALARLSSPDRTLTGRSDGSETPPNAPEQP